MLLLSRVVSSLLVSSSSCVVVVVAFERRQGLRDNDFHAHMLSAQTLMPFIFADQLQLLSLARSDVTILGFSWGRRRCFSLSRMRTSAAWID